MQTYEMDADAVVSDVGSNVLIQASAGTGKTYNLVQRVLAILRHDRVSIDQILVLTFTEAAAAEMQSRIFSGIKDAEAAASGSDRAFFAQQKLRFGRHRIGTIHSFAGWVIRQSGDEVSMLTERPVPDGYDVPGGLEGAEGAVWTGSYEQIDEYMSAMLTAQWRHDFVRVYSGHASVTQLLEYAGSMGRFFDLLGRATQLSDDSLRRAAAMDGEALVAITSRYAQVLREEMEAPFGRLWALAGEYRPCLDRDFPASLDDFLEVGSDWYTKSGTVSMKRVKDGCGQLSREEVAGNLSRWLKPLKALIDLGQLHTNLYNAIIHGDLEDSLSGRLDAAIFAKMKLIAEVALRWKQYHRWRRASDGMMNFDDLIDICHKLLHERPAVKSMLQQRFRHILVDEFQDTDARQWEIVQSIHGDGKDRKLFLVGDMKQAIYGFRGGNVSLIRKVEEAAVQDPAYLRLATLTVSRRSAKEIIDFVNGLFARQMNPVGHERAFQASYMPLEPLNGSVPNDGSTSGTVRYLSYQSPNVMFAGGIHAEDLRLANFVSQGRQVIDAYKLAHFIAEIREDIGGEKYPEYRNVGDKLRRGEKAIGILLRTQSNVDHLTTAFRLFGLKAAVRVGSGFFGRQEVSDLYYLVRFLDDAWDDMALAAVLRSPYFSISDLGLLAIANKVQALGGRTSWWVVLNNHLDELDLVANDRKILALAVKLLREWRTDVRGRRVSDVLAKTFLQTAFLIGQTDVAMATENAHKLVDLIRGLEDRGSSNVGQISNWIRLQLEGTSSTDALVPGSASIEITTMHRSKGLQYPMVILSNVAASGQANSGLQVSPIDTHDTHIPLMVWRTEDDVIDSEGKKDSFLYDYTKRQIDERDGAETLRLLYVALTRAESHIVISDPMGLGGKASVIQSILHRYASALRGQDDVHWFKYDEIGKSDYEELFNSLMSRISGVHNETNRLDAPIWASSGALAASQHRANAKLERPSDHDVDDGSDFEAVANPWRVLRPDHAGSLIHMMLEWPELDDESATHRIRIELEGLEYPYSKMMDLDIALLRIHAQNARAYLRRTFQGARQFISEMPFEVWLDNEDHNKAVWVRGTIDLLVEDDTGNWHVIDFKTSTLDAEQILRHAKSSGYHHQLTLYARALKVSSKGSIDVSPDRAKLVFTAFESGRSVTLAEIS